MWRLGASCFAHPFSRTTHITVILSTNTDEILAQYNICSPPPFLNHVDAILGGEQCSQNFSYPRFFFNEWYKSEVKRQEKKKEESRRRRRERRERREAKVSAPHFVVVVVVVVKKKKTSTKTKKKMKVEAAAIPLTCITTI